MPKKPKIEKYIYETVRGLVVQVPGKDGKVRTRRAKTLAEARRVKAGLVTGLKVVPNPKANEVTVTTRKFKIYCCCKEKIIEVADEGEGELAVEAAVDDELRIWVDLCIDKGWSEIE